MRSFLLNRAIIDLLILLLEELPESWAVMPSIALGPQTDTIIVGLVSWEFREPSLSKVPQGMCSMHSGLCSRFQGLAAHSTNEKGIVLLGNSVSEIGRLNVATFVFWCSEIDGDVCQDIVREPDLSWLIEVQHVYLVVPRP